MSEAELGWLRQRAHEARAAKAQRGELIISLPVGYVQTRDGRLEKHPDQRVQAALALIFQKFTDLGSARQVLLWMHQEQIGRLEDAERLGQVVAIVGEAGVGKSRLTYEFTHSHRVQDWLILEASSVSYGKATSYPPRGVRRA